ncbi:MAG: glycosyltransferase family 4 protein [Anaerolineae bacterium]
MRICVLTSVHQPFDGRIFYRESRTLARAGYEVTLIAPADFQWEERDDVTVLGVPRPTSRLGRPRIWWRLYSLVRRLQPDVIHLHDPELLLLVPLLRLTMGRRLKIVYDVHEYFADSLAGKYWIPARLRPLARFAAKWLERLLVRWVQGIVCAVEEQKSLYGGFRGPITVVRNLPFAALFENAKQHPTLNVRGFKLIYVGLILPKRGINVLMEAMRVLREQGMTDVHLFLIGPDTSPAYIQELQAFAQAHQFERQLHWLGYVPHEQIKHYLVSADVGMAPGLRTRQYQNPGISTKLFEYMLSALPIISVDHPHRRVYIEESDCGLLVPPQDASAYAESVLWLRAHPHEARVMGQRGRAMVLDHYTWEQEQSSLLEFYRKLSSR